MPEVSKIILIQLRILKKNYFFLNGNIEHHSILSLFDNRKPVRHVSILISCCSYKSITKFPKEQVNYKSYKVSNKEVFSLRT